MAAIRIQALHHKRLQAFKTLQQNALSYQKSTPMAEMGIMTLTSLLENNNKDCLTMGLESIISSGLEPLCESTVMQNESISLPLILQHIFKNRLALNFMTLKGSKVTIEINQQIELLKGLFILMKVFQDKKSQLNHTFITGLSPLNEPALLTNLSSSIIPTQDFEEKAHNYNDGIDKLQEFVNRKQAPVFRYFSFLC